MNPYDALTQSLRLSTPELSSRDGGRETPLAILISSTAYRAVRTVERFAKGFKRNLRH